MIKTSELRIGNYILFNKQPIMVKGLTVNAVMLDRLMQQTDNPNLPYQYQLFPVEDERLEPITLTDDVLQKIRVRIPTKGGKAFTYYSNRSTFLIFEEEEGYFIGMNYMDQVYRVTPQPLYYFHQLQNVYYAQYGAEFDFNEKSLVVGIRNAVEKGLI